jgi:hypothetical protein
MLRVRLANAPALRFYARRGYVLDEGSPEQCGRPAEPFSILCQPVRRTAAASSPWHRAAESGDTPDSIPMKQ